MKNWLTQLIGVCAAVFLFSSCEKDEVQVTAQPGDAPTLTASVASVSLVQENAGSPAVTYTWKPATYGYAAAQTYTIQFDKKDNKFAKPYNYNAGSSLTKTFTVSEINAAMLALGLTPGTDSQVEVRVVSNLATNAPVNPVKAMMSASTTLAGSPYLSFITYPALYVPGNHQGWSPQTAPLLASPADDKVYEGYVNFTEAGGFKFTPARNWDNDYGSDGSAFGLKPKGSDLMIPDAGYYRIIVNLNTNSYSLLKTSWGIIGSATANDWNSDTPMTYDATKGVWTITTALKAGEMKFRTNSWDADKNFGDNEPNGMPDYDGKNIKIETAGTYTITLDLSKGKGNYSYSLAKQ
ncbi:SusE domain-containing protein [Hymenobacter sp. DG25A]|uniref:SusE domain-containing protein n=1 Tax=Hymenobacter sp. DG25A TaxID=1385663 RepID=UPI0006BC81A2|nr:SusE domain-containing protein [Hymenobacter sp. DG25A]ALD21206.1 hypothetical protein AM218_08235 [Hymenobacter sp. DG25A]